MSVSQGTAITSSVGRIVWGHPGKLTQRTDVHNKPVFKEDGTPAMQAAFGLAIPMNDFLANEWPAMQAEAGKAYPNGVPQNFSWKIKNGDTDKDSNGNPLSEKEGYAGCYILTVVSNTGYPVNMFKFNGSTYEQLQPEQVKTGDYVAVALNLQVNVPQQRTHTPSLYINPQGVELVGYGKEIVAAGINPMAAFGGVQRQLPPGASSTPMSSSAGAGVQMPGSAPMGGAPGGMPGAPAGQPGMQQPAMQPAPQYQQPAPQYQQPAPGGAPGYPQQQPGMQPAPQYQQPAMQPGGMPAPAHDFVQNAAGGAVPQYQQPAMQPGMQPAPGGAPGYPQQQPGMGGAPVGMPGMMPQR